MADVSVVIPCYNAESFIAETIESVLAQTDPPRQVLVIDDGSTDGSADIVQRYVASSAGVVELIRQANAGESRARNVGIEQARGRYVAFLDADDLWLPVKLSLQIDLIERRPEAVGVHTRLFNFEKHINDHGRAETERTMDDPSVEDLMAYHWVAPSSLMVRRQVLIDRSIRFDEKINRSEDMLFVADLRLAGRLRLVDEPLVAKRVHAAQQSKDPWHPVWSLQSRVLWCRKRIDKLGAELSASIEDRLGEKMIRVIEDRYWRRQIEGLSAASQCADELFPDSGVASKVLGRKLLPRWAYQLKDAVTGKMQA